jgi:hypothetical protein
VSEAVVPIAASTGLGWMATDEVILARSRRIGFSRDGQGHVEQPEILYRPYRVGIGKASIACLFRDHVLSDLIGFTYAGWSSEAAARNLLDRILEAGRRYRSRTGGGEATVGIALDGENAWEYYEGSGRPFLRTFYHLLSTHPELRTVTMSEATAAASDTLETLAAGSWANGDFYIWIGHADDRRAWGQLADARRAVSASCGAVDAAAWQAAHEHVLIAEGSDWFWWYGDDHSSDQDLEFDALFRSHLQSVYLRLGLAVPEELQFSNITAGLKTTEIVQPVGSLQPTIDGRADPPDEWDAAGYQVLRHYWGAMRQASEATEARVTGIRFGFDFRHLFVRVDFNGRAGHLFENGLSLRMAFLGPGGLRLNIAGDPAAPRVSLEARRRQADATWHTHPTTARVGIDAIVEVAIPLEDLGVAAGDRVAFFVRVNRGEAELGHYPSQIPVTAMVPSGLVDSRESTVESLDHGNHA